MRSWHFLTALLVIGVVGCSSRPGVRAEGPEQSASRSHTEALTISEARSALDQARFTLSQLDSRLDYPITPAEAQASDKTLDRALDRMKTSDLRKRSVSDLANTADDARDLAQKASDSAAAGDRRKALDYFTQSRTKLQEARLTMAALGIEPTRIGARPETVVTPGDSAAPRDKTLLKLRGKEGIGDIRVGPDGLKIEGLTGEGEWGRVLIGPEGIVIEGED